MPILQHAQRLWTGPGAPGEIITNGLVGRWPLTEGAGTMTADHSGNGYDMTLLNMDDTNWVADRNGYVLQFNGTNETGEAGDVLDFDAAEPWSLCAWVYPMGAAASFPLCKMRSNRGYYVYLWPQSPSFGLIAVHRYNSTTGLERRISSPVVPLSQWTSVIVTYDGSARAAGLMFYVNGLFVSSSAQRDNLSGTTVNDGLFTMGSRDASDGFFNGRLDELRVYDRALTAQEAELIGTDQG